MRKDALRVAQDPVQREIDVAAKLIDLDTAAIGRITTRSMAGEAMKADWIASRECLSNYRGYLQVIQQPTLAAMHTQLDAESAARVESKVSAQREAERTAEEQVNEAARQRKEVDRAAALADEQALQRKREIEEQIRAGALKLPPCDAAAATQALKDKFELIDTPLKTIGLARDDDPAFGGTVPDPERHCLAKADTRSASFSVSYVIRWRDADHIKILVTVAR